MQRRAQLLDAGGAPVQASYPIPFIRIFPFGERGLQQVDRGEALYALACRFIAGGGRYGIYIKDDGSVDLVALMKGPNGDETPIATETSSNDARLLEAVDRIVKASVANIPAEAA